MFDKVILTLFRFVFFSAAQHTKISKCRRGEKREREKVSDRMRMGQVKDNNNNDKQQIQSNC